MILWRPRSLNKLNSVIVLLAFAAFLVAVFRQKDRTTDIRTLRLGLLLFTFTVVVANMQPLLGWTVFDIEPFGLLAPAHLPCEVRRIARRRGWAIDVHPIDALLHNHPERLAPSIERSIERLLGRYDALAAAYADCGSYRGDRRAAGRTRDRATRRRPLL